MLRIVLPLLALLSQVISGVDGCLMVCTHQDGTAQIEWTGSPCCDEGCHSAEPIAVSTCSGCGDCTDMPLFLHQVTVARAAAHDFVLHAVAAQPPLAIADLSRIAAVPLLANNSCGPPGNILHCINTIVIRC